MKGGNTVIWCEMQVVVELSQICFPHLFANKPLLRLLDDRESSVSRCDGEGESLVSRLDEDRASVGDADNKDCGGGALGPALPYWSWL